MRPVFCALTSRWTHSNGVRSLPVLSACTTCVCVGASGRGEGGGSERGAGEEERWGELNLSELQSRAEQLQAFLSSASSSSKEEEPRAKYAACALFHASVSSQGSKTSTLVAARCQRQEERARRRARGAKRLQ
jgi:hypothetical protein